MLLSRGRFRRGGAPREARDWDLVAADDPHGFADLTRLVHWRRAMPTINFALGSATVNWDSGNSVGLDQRAGLENQTRRNIMGAQQGPIASPLGHRRLRDVSVLGTSERARRRASRLGRCTWRSRGVAQDAADDGPIRSLRRVGRSREPSSGADHARAGAVQRRERWWRKLQRLS